MNVLFICEVFHLKKSLFLFVIEYDYLEEAIFVIFTCVKPYVCTVIVRKYIYKYIDVHIQIYRRTYLQYVNYLKYVKLFYFV